MKPIDEDEPNIVYSKFCQEITRDGVHIEISIIRLENSDEWTLEVVNDKGTSIVWDDPFTSDQEAYDELIRTIETEGMETFLDSAKVIRFPLH